MDIEQYHQSSSEQKNAIKEVLAEYKDDTIVLRKRQPGYKQNFGPKIVQKRGRPKQPTKTPIYYKEDFSKSDFSIEFSHETNLFIPVKRKRIKDEYFTSLIYDNIGSYVVICRNDNHAEVLEQILSSYTDADYCHSQANNVRNCNFQIKKLSKQSETLRVDSNIAQFLSCKKPQEHIKFKHYDTLKDLDQFFQVIVLRYQQGKSYDKIKKQTGLSYFKQKKLLKCSESDIQKIHDIKNYNNKIFDRKYLYSWIKSKISLENRYITSQRDLIQTFRRDHNKYDELKYNTVKRKLIESRVIQAVNPIQKPFTKKEVDYSKLNFIYAKLLIYFTECSDNLFFYDECSVSNKEFLKKVYGSYYFRPVARIANYKKLSIFCIYNKNGIQAIQIFRKKSTQKDSIRFISQFVRKIYHQALGEDIDLPKIFMDLGNKNLCDTMKSISSKEKFIGIYNNASQCRLNQIEYQFSKLKEPVKVGWYQSEEYIIRAIETYLRNFDTQKCLNINKRWLKYLQSFFSN